MDNDNYRRGKPSTHKKFDEATAILAGDSLHDFAFQLLSGNLKHIEPSKNLQLINYLTICTGYNGLEGGQSQDLLYENKKEIDQTRLILVLGEYPTGRDSPAIYWASPMS